MSETGIRRGLEKKVRFDPQFLSDTTSDTDFEADMPAFKRIKAQNASSNIETRRGIDYMSLNDARILSMAQEKRQLAQHLEAQESPNIVNDLDALNRCLERIQYRVDSKASRVPWIEHLSLIVNRYVVEDEAILPEEDQKREATFRHITELGVREALRRLCMLKLPFSRPQDFYAEMLKPDIQMNKIQKKLIEQQTKIKCVEERKKKKLQKKFAKELRAEKLQQKQREKIENLKKVEKWKKSKFQTPL